MQLAFPCWVPSNYGGTVESSVRPDAVPIDLLGTQLLGLEALPEELRRCEQLVHRD